MVHMVGYSFFWEIQEDHGIGNHGISALLSSMHLVIIIDT